jgi:drug/metabolite transporter (DMT)-like permease
VILCTLAMTVLGGSFPVSRLILGYPVLTGQALRYALAAAVLAALVRPGTRPDRRALVRLAALAASGLVGFNICVLNALRSGTPPLLGTVIGAAPLALAFLGPALARQRPSARLVGAAAVVVAGVALVEGGGHGSLAAFGWALGALAGEVLFSVLAAPLLSTLGPVRVSAWSCGLAVPMLLIAAGVTEEWRHWRIPTASEGTGLLYLALPLTVGAFLLWYTGLRRLGVARAGMFAGVLPLATLAVTSVLDARMPGTLALAGTALVATGLVSGSWRAAPGLTSDARREGVA